MKRASRGFALHPPAAAAPELSLAEVAQRSGLTKVELEQLARKSFLEPTYSIEEIATHLGCEKWQVNQLVRLGIRHGAKLHPTRGGLYPTFKASHKSRRIPLSAIERHKRHMSAVHDHAAA